MIFITFRVNGLHISPNVRNAIHPGDRILEINGAPIRTLQVEEVSLVWSPTFFYLSILPSLSCKSLCCPSI